MLADRIMYCCTSCARHNPEMCGYFARDNLRVMPNGDWLCDSCFDDARPLDEEKVWSDYPQPPEYGPLVSSTEQQP